MTGAAHEGLLDPLRHSGIESGQSCQVLAREQVVKACPGQEAHELELARSVVVSEASLCELGGCTRPSYFDEIEVQFERRKSVTDSVRVGQLQERCLKGRK